MYIYRARIEGGCLVEKNDKKHRLCKTTIPFVLLFFCVLRKTYAHEMLKLSTYDNLRTK